MKDDNGVNLGQYFVRYDKNKKYNKILAIPGRVAQASDWNDNQYMVVDKIKRLGDTFYKNGNIINGMELSIVEDANTHRNYARIAKGAIYLDGDIREFDSTMIEIAGVGEERLCPYVHSELITESEDTALYDPAEGNENYGQPGMHAIKETVSIGINRENAPVIYTIKDGKLQTSKSAENQENNEYARITEILARRTYDESGNYRKRGLLISQRFDYPNPDPDRLYFTCTKGKAYVLGYEVEKPADFTFSVPKSKETRLIQGDIMSVRKGSNGNYQFIMRHTPIRSINEFLVQRTVTDTVTRGAVKDGEDVLPHTPVVAGSVTKVEQNGVVYNQFKDYYVSGNNIVWRSENNGSPEKQPNPGSGYKVTYNYNFNVASDPAYYKIYTYKGRQVVEIIDPTIIPAQGTAVSFSYNFYLARKDLISIDKNGNIIDTIGIPDLEDKVVPPVVNDDNTLSLGSIFLKGNGDVATIINMSIEDSTMEDIQNTIRRVDDLEYNDSITDLDKKAIEGEPATQLRGVFTDGFISFTKADVNYDKGSDKYDCLIDIDSQELQLPFTTNNVDLTVNEAGDTSKSEMGVIITTPYIEEVALTQPTATQTMLVNPYQVFDPLVPITLSPSVDNWVENEKITTTENTGTTMINADLHRDIGSGNARVWWNKAASKYFENMANVTAEFTNEYRGHAESGIYASEVTQKKTTQVKDSLITYIRSRPVTIKSAGFPAFAKNIRCYFDSIPVSLTPKGTTKVGDPYTIGTQSYTSVTADAEGNVEAVFTIPKNVPCGTKEVKIEYLGDAVNKAKSGSTTYTANGRKHTTIETIFEHKTVVHAVDPLAETFMFTQEKYLTSVDLFFASNTDNNLPIVVQIRNVVNGYPGAECYSEVIVPHNMIKTSSDASVPTKVTFGNAIKCLADTQYCIVIMSDSAKPAMWVSQLGEREVKTGKVVNSNPYTAGVLFSSSNAMTWTAHQDMDLKFTLRTAKFNETGSIEFKRVLLNQVDYIVLSVDASVPAETSLTWEYRINSSGAWQPLEIYNLAKLENIANKIDLRCTYKAKTTRAPMISSQCMSLTSYSSKLKGKYISRQVEFDNTFNDIKLYLNECKNTGATIKVYYSVDDGANWVLLKDSEATTKTVDSEFTEYYWHKDHLTPSKKLRIKIELQTNSAIGVLTPPRCKKLIVIAKTI